MMENQKPKILLVDDRPENIFALEKVLEHLDVEIISTVSGNEGLALTLENDFALILLDVQMPEMDGFEMAGLLRENEESQYTPIIFITAINKDPKHVFKGYESGAVDYVFKPVNSHILISKVKAFTDLYQQRKTLELYNEELKKANERIIEQQRNIVEKERLKVLLQMAGATAHEINQPLTGLLGYVELLEYNKDHPHKLIDYIKHIKMEGERIVNIVKKIQKIRHHEVKPYLKDRKSDQYIIDIENQPVKMLFLDRDRKDYEVVGTIFDEIENYHVTYINTLSKIKDRLQRKEPFDLLFSELAYEDGTAYDLLKYFHENEIEIPIVIITHSGDELIASKIIQLGASDYLPKNKITKSALIRIVESSLERSQLKSELKKVQQKIAEMAVIDEITGLYNRRYFKNTLKAEVDRAKRCQTDLSLCMLDLDHFKTVNDSFGHSAGDRVLNETAKIIKQFTRQYDVCCRYGGEEFTIILPQTTISEAAIIGEKIRKSIEKKTIIFDQFSIHVNVSIGIANYNHKSGPSYKDFIECADRALYRAKNSGRNRVIQYEDVASCEMKDASGKTYVIEGEARGK